ncbi:MAG: sel1 repeat family protein [Opitutales bacterium]|nr:sel1 repeat family protein [Opitutales bacterium]
MKYSLIILLIFIFAEVFAQSLADLANTDATSKDDEVATKAKTTAKQVSTENRKQGSVPAKNISKEISQEEFDSIFLKASQGDSNSQLALGVLYARGVKPTNPNGELALEWLLKSAKQGNLAAMTYMGAIYSEGKLVKRDIQKAIYWRELAAEKGSAADKYALANAFIYGYMLPADKQKAFLWLTKAGEAGHIDAINQLISIYTNNGDKQNVKRWKTEKSYAQIKLAQSGNVVAMYEAYRLYVGGKGGVFRSIPKAIYWLKKASDAGHIHAVETLAMMYINGKYLAKDFSKGITMLEKLAEKDSNYAVKVSNLYGENGENQDLKKAGLWLDKASKKLTGIAKLHIVWKLWAGSGVVKDTKKASVYCDEIISTLKSDSHKKIIQKIKSDIDSGKIAPEKYSDLFK